jgi:hypothetical protein
MVVFRWDKFQVEVTAMGGVVLEDVALHDRF